MSDLVKASKDVQEIKKKKLHIAFVLDETGSMHSIKNDTVGGYNEYVNTVRQTQPTALFTLVKFNSMRVFKVYRNVPMRHIRPMKHEDYQPAGATPLIDAVVNAIHVAEEEEAGDAGVAVVVLTDGEENCSTEFDSSFLRRLIGEKRRQGWLFTFLGADLDAFKQARVFGFDWRNTISFSGEDTKDAFAASARATLSYAATGDAASATYTQDERDSVHEDEVLRLAKGTK